LSVETFGLVEIQDTRLEARGFYESKEDYIRAFAPCMRIAIASLGLPDMATGGVTDEIQVYDAEI
jgi:hypothetical protein